MDLSNAVAAHAQWKTRFRVAITNRDILDAATIGKDNCCELGKWLYAEGRGLYGVRPEFTKVLEKHKAFHVQAGKVANAINARQYTEAETMINAGTPFAAASTEVGLAINSLKDAAA